MKDNPFAPSQLDATENRQPEIAKTYTFKSASILARIITYLMYGCMLLTGLFAIIQIAVHRIDYLNPNAVYESAIQLRLLRTAAIMSGINIPVLLAIAFVVCWFMYRTNANCRALGAENMKFTPGWSCGYWFIPLVNLFRPYQAMKEIYKASVSPSGDSWKSIDRLPIFPLWWTGWLLGDILENAAELTDESNARFGILLASAALKILAGVCLIRIVAAIVRQQEKHAPASD